MDDSHQSVCTACSGTGYAGRFVLAEQLIPENPSFSAAVMDRADTSTLQTIAKEGGMTTLAERAASAIDGGLTTPEEVYRVLGRTSPLEA